MRWPIHTVAIMFILELEFTDDPRRLAARQAHRERLLALQTAGRLVMAGPWADDTGAMLVFDTNRDEVDRILSDDPYYAAPGVRVKSLREWQPILSPPESPTGK